MFKNILFWLELKDEFSENHKKHTKNRFLHTKKNSKH